MPCKQGWIGERKINPFGYKPPFTIRIPISEGIMKFLTIALIIAIVVVQSLSFTLWVMGSLIVFYLIMGFGLLSLSPERHSMRTRTEKNDDSIRPPTDPQS